MARSKRPETPLAGELFHAIAVLVSRLSHLAEEKCGVSTIELLTLWHTRHFGKPYINDQSVILRQELTRVLRTKFGYMDGAVSKLLATLQDKGFIVRAAVSTSERAPLFGSHGDTRVVILNKNGDSKIEEFKDQIRSRATTWLVEQNMATRATVKSLRPVVERFARWLVGRYEPERESILYETERSGKK